MELEAQQVKYLIQGDQKSFEALFLKYHPRVKRFLLGFIKDEEEVNDMIQEVFFKVWIIRENISKTESFNFLLFRIARNMVYNFYEHTLVKNKYVLSQEKSYVLYTDLIEEEIYAEELGLLIDIAIEKMPEQRRTIFKMSRKEGLSNSQIAEKLNLNKRTIENHITNALADLRGIIKSALSILF